MIAVLLLLVLLFAVLALRHALSEGLVRAAFTGVLSGSTLGMAFCAALIPSSLAVLAGGLTGKLVDCVRREQLGPPPPPGPRPIPAPTGPRMIAHPG